MEQWWALVGNKSAYKQLKEKFSLEKPKKTSIKKLIYKNNLLEQIVNELMLNSPDIRKSVEHIIKREKDKKNQNQTNIPFITRLPSRNKTDKLL